MRACEKYIGEKNLNFSNLKHKMKVAEGSHSSRRFDERTVCVHVITAAADTAGRVGIILAKGALLRLGGEGGEEVGHCFDRTPLD